MDSKRIAFIICANNDMKYNECIYYLSRLNVPDGYDVDVIKIEDAKSMAAGYNEGMEVSDAKYKVYLHQDVFIYNTNFVQDIIDVFEKDEKIGMLGVIGGNNLPQNACMWNCWNVGCTYGCNIKSAIKGVGEQDSSKLYLEVEAVDGMLVATQYDIPWREDLDLGWDFYDISQCMEFRRQGYKIVVPYQGDCWCMHDCGQSKLIHYDSSRQVILEEYKDFFSAEYEEVVNKQKIKMEEEIFRKFCAFYKKKDYETAFQIVDRLKESDISNNDLLLAKNIKEIYEMEKNEDGISFFCDIKDWKDTKEKYDKIKYILRYIERNTEFDAINFILQLIAEQTSFSSVVVIATHSIYRYEEVLKKIIIEVNIGVGEMNAKQGMSYEEEIDRDLCENGPLVSVILPAYNHEEYVAAAIESVINQSYKNIELLVADDASTDGTAEVMKRYSQYFAKEFYFKENGGGRGIFLSQQATGKYLAIMHSDDVWVDRDKIALQVAYLEKHEECGACLSWARYMDENEQVLDDYIFIKENRNSYDWMKFFWEKGNALCNQSTLIRKGLEENISWYGRLCRQLPDFFKWIGIVQKTQIHIIPKVMVHARRFSNEKGENTSAMSRTNMVRYNVEIATCWMWILRDMDADFFKKAFHDYMINPQAETEEEIKCEKYFLMLKSTNIFMQQSALYYIVECHVEIAETLKNKYNYTRKDYHRDEIEKGFSNLYLK